MPGIDSRAPLRTETSSGSPGSPSFLPACSSRSDSASATCSSRPSGKPPSRMYATHASVVIVKPRGHALGTEHARHLRDVGPLPAEQVAHVARPLAELVDPLRRDLGPHDRAILSRGRGSQPNAGVVLDRLGDRALGLAQRPLGGVGRGGERRAERAREELVRRLVEREARRLARAADDAAGRAREAREVVLRAAGRAGGELRREPGREQQLEAERELVRARRPGGVGVEQRELVAEQVVDLGVRLVGLEQAGDRVARARGSVEGARRRRAGARSRRPSRPPSR